jgi:hypothetical protein
VLPVALPAPLLIIQNGLDFYRLAGADSGKRLARAYLPYTNTAPCPSEARLVLAYLGRDSQEQCQMLSTRKGSCRSQSGSDREKA